MLDVITKELPAAPTAIARDTDVPELTNQYANDRVGDCTAASMAQLIETWTDYGRNGKLVTTDDVIRIYSAGSGYIVGNPTTDIGADMLTMLKAWRTVGIGGHKIDAFVKLDHHDLEQVRTAIHLFGGVYIGLDLPLTAQMSGDWRNPADLTGENVPGSWGGHCVSASRFDRTGVWLRTWGHRQRAEWGWWLRYVDECYAPLGTDWVHGDEAPNGLNIEKLRAYLAALRKN